VTEVELARVALPDFGVPLERPAISGDEYEKRLADFRAASDCEWLVVYGDREHFANLTFLTGFDPRFEEALLVLSATGDRHLIVGNEGMGYVKLLSLRFDVVLCQSLSLMGQDRSSSPSLSQCLREIGIGSGTSVGVAGWKYLAPEEWGLAGSGIAAPAFLVDALRDLVADAHAVEDVTAILMDPLVGLRARNSADQAAAFEWASARASRAVMRIVAAAVPGISELEAVSAMGYAGEPLAAHLMFASGDDDIVGLRSPTARVLQEEDAVTTAVSYWGGLTCRAGVLRAEPDDDFSQTLGSPYFRAIATWYETLRLGISGGDLFAAIDDVLSDTSFRPLVNPGHLIHLDEWVHSPIVPEGKGEIAAGMALQCDIIPSPAGTGRALNCEDGVVVADAALRNAIARRHPEVWNRMVARQRFMRDSLGIDIADEVLPLSSCPAYLAPFWLDSSCVYVNA
jgi:hypothetical protein